MIGRECQLTDSLDFTCILRSIEGVSVFTNLKFGLLKRGEPPRYKPADLPVFFLLSQGRAGGFSTTPSGITKKMQNLATYFI